MTVGIVDGRFTSVVWIWRGKLIRIIQRGGREMRKSGRIVRYAPKEVEERIAHGDDRTDWARVEAMSETALEAAIRSDSDADIGPIDLSRACVGVPGPKEELHLQLDAGVLDWFKSQSRNYRARINAVLRAYVEHQRERSRST